MSSQRVVVTGRGGPEVLELVSGETPQPARGEVVVRVEAAGVAFGDVMRRRGMLAPRRPFTPGYDVVGRVQAVDARVEGVAEGDRVAAFMPKVGIGGYAEHVRVPGKVLVPVPEGADAAELVCLGLNYITAYQMLHRFAPVAAGDRALVHGAAGGVGTALLDLGGLAGLELYGTASARKHDLVRDRGATPIDYRTEDFVQRIAELTPDGVDVCFDGIGGAHLEQSYRAVRPGGTLVCFGVSGDADGGVRGVARGMGTFAKLKLRRGGPRVRLYLITMSRGASARQCRDDWAELVRLYTAGKLRPVVGARVPLAEVRRAHQLMDEAAVVGKIVLECA